MEFLQRVAHVDPANIVNIDGMVQSAGDFLQRYGWAPRGEEVKRIQFSIQGITYAVHAAYTCLGFLGWIIYIGSVSEDEVKSKR